MEHIIIGTAGHIDHGKTELIRALTGRDTDTLKEEKRRGISIDLGFTWFDLPGGNRAGVIDVPGHEKFLPNMLAGVCGMDLVLLVIAMSFVLFNADSLSQASSDYRALFGFGGLPAVTKVTLYYLRSYAVLFLLGILGATPLPRRIGARIAASRAGTVLTGVFLAAVLLVCTAYMVDGSFSPFLYFRF